MHPTTTLRLCAVLGGLAVGLGAFAAHGMKDHFDPAQMQTFETGVRYQMYHALALFGCGVLGRLGARTGLAAWLFLVGIVLFSGSLYALVWTGVKGLGAVTPFGGVAFLAGWLVLAVTGTRTPERP
jgi:uncharacterized membrane protein YgdD (TMEM256/DUF423 family)